MLEGIFELVPSSKKSAKSLSLTVSLEDADLSGFVTFFEDGIKAKISSDIQPPFAL